jgi:type II secretory ATPase GspE/PulE/Tfp pilus assembly ATPase PilB-like protein
VKAVEKRIAGRLLSSGALTEAQLQSVLKDYDGSSPIAALLVSRGIIQPRDACRAEAEVNGLQFVELDEVAAQPEALAVMTAQGAWQHLVLPLSIEGSTLTLAMANPNDLLVIDSLRLKLKMTVISQVAERGDMERALIRYYGPNPADRPIRPSREVPLPQLVETPFGVPEFDQLPTQPLLTPPPPATVTSGSNIYAKPTLVDVPKLNVNDIVEQIKRKSGSDEVSHREFQRRMRELKEVQARQGDDPGGISHAATQFLESSDSTLSGLEAARGQRGAYEPPTDSTRLERLSAELESPAITELRRLLDSAVEQQAREVEFTPEEGGIRVRFRKTGVWHPVEAYPSEFHSQVIGRLRLMAGLELKPQNLATEHQFLYPAARHHVLCTLHLERTSQGDRAVVRMSENVPLLDSPFEALGLPEEELLALNTRLYERGGGLLFVTSPSARSLAQIYMSLMKALSQDGRRDVLSLERPNERRVPGITSISCPNEEILLASLANASFMNPDVLGMQSVENGTVLNRVVNMAMRGTTTIAGFVAPDSRTGLACLKAARLDPMNVVRGVAGYLHVTEAAALCPSCRQLIEDFSTLPEWARLLEAPFMEANGCPKCESTGRQGTQWLLEYHRPDLMAADGSFLPIVGPDRDVLAFSIAGLIDPREFPLSL